MVQVFPTSTLRTQIVGSLLWRPLPDNFLLGCANGCQGAQDERGHHGQNVPKRAATLSYAKVSRASKNVPHVDTDAGYSIESSWT